MRRLSIFVVAVAMALLVGCQSTPSVPSVSPLKLTAYQKMLVAQIRHDGVQVVKQGDHLQMILPIDTFFQHQSTEVKYSKQNALNVIATFVKSYVQRVHGYPNVQVTGHTDRVFAKKTRNALSKEYANVIAAYLWNHGIPQNRLSVKEVGASQPVASNRSADGNAMNRRVVIQIL